MNRWRPKDICCNNDLPLASFVLLRSNLKHQRQIFTGYNVCIASGSVFAQCWLQNRWFPTVSAVKHLFLFYLQTKTWIVACKKIINFVLVQSFFIRSEILLLLRNENAKDNKSWKVKTDCLTVHMVTSFHARLILNSFACKPTNQFVCITFKLGTLVTIWLCKLLGFCVEKSRISDFEVGGGNIHFFVQIQSTSKSFFVWREKFSTRHEIFQLFKMSLVPFPNTLDLKFFCMQTQKSIFLSEL